MSETIKVVDFWQEEEFPFDADSAKDMAAVHEILPTGWYLVDDLSAGYDCPNEDARFIMLFKGGQNE